jgi:hypothetical protein
MWVEAMSLVQKDLPDSQLLIVGMVTYAMKHG